MACQELGFGCLTGTLSQCSSCIAEHAFPTGQRCKCTGNYYDPNEQDTVLQCDAKVINAQVRMHKQVSQCPSNTTTPTLENLKTEAERVVLYVLKARLEVLLSNKTTTMTACTPSTARRADMQNFTVVVAIEARGFLNVTDTLIGTTLMLPATANFGAQEATVMPTPLVYVGGGNNRARDGKIAGAVIGSVVGCVLLILIPRHWLRNAQPRQSKLDEPDGIGEVELEAACELEEQISHLDETGQNV
jgi:hypothetical protein